MKKTLLFATAIMLVLVLAGCASLTMESKIKKTVSMTNMDGAEPRMFTSSARAVWLFWGLVPVSVPNIDEIIGTQVADRTGVQNLKITTKNSFLDLVINVLTDGIITTRSVKIEGEVYY